MGGIGFVWGYELSLLGLCDMKMNDLIGGLKMLVGNIELMFLLLGIGYDCMLCVFMFFDGGNVWGNVLGGMSMGVNGLCYGYGVGFVWILLIGLLKLSFGFLL